MIDKIYPLGTKRTFANQKIRIRLKCYQRGCTNRISGVEGYNGKFSCQYGELDLRNQAYYCGKHFKLIKN